MGIVGAEFPRQMSVKFRGFEEVIPTLKHWDSLLINAH